MRSWSDGTTGRRDEVLWLHRVRRAGHSTHEHRSGVRSVRRLARRCRGVGVDEVGLKGWYLSRLRALGTTRPTDSSSPLLPTRPQHERPTSIIVSAPSGRRPGTHQADDIAVLARKARHLIAQIRFDGALTQAIGTALDDLRDHRRRESERSVPVAVRSSTAPGAVSGPECAGVHASFTDVVDLAARHQPDSQLLGIAVRRTSVGDARPRARCREPHDGGGGPTDGPRREVGSRHPPRHGRRPARRGDLRAR